MTEPTKGASTSSRPRGRPPTGARDALVRAMRELLLERDFDDIATEEVLARAGVSRGAMYHHFASKVELFKAAYEASEQDALQRLGESGAQAAADSGPFDFLVAGCLAYVRASAQPGELQRIGLRQSRAVLGWEGWRKAADPLGIGLIRATVQAAVDAGELASDDVATTAHLLLAMLIEAGLIAAANPQPERALTRLEPEIIRMLEGLRRR